MGFLSSLPIPRMGRSVPLHTTSVPPYTGYVHCILTFLREDRNRRSNQDVLELFFGNSEKGSASGQPEEDQELERGRQFLRTYIFVESIGTTIRDIQNTAWLSGTPRLIWKEEIWFASSSVATDFSCCARFMITVSLLESVSVFALWIEKQSMI